MPGYAKSIYLYYLFGNNNHIIKDDNQLLVLDQSMGWGDRLLGAMSCLNKCNIRYIGFDPNKALRYGYVDIMKLFNKSIINITDTYIEYKLSKI